MKYVILLIVFSLSEITIATINATQGRWLVAAIWAFAALTCSLIAVQTYKSFKKWERMLKVLQDISNR